MSSGRPHKLCVYQAGRGHEPVVVAAKGTSLVAVKAIVLSSQLNLSLLPPNTPPAAGRSAYAVPVAISVDLAVSWRRRRSPSGTRTSSSVRRIDAVELPHDRVETDISEMLITHPLRRLYCSFNDIIPRQRQFATARLGGDLYFATALQIVHQDERLGDTASVGKSAVITQEHHALAAEIGGKVFLFLGTESGAVVIVIGNLAMKGDAD